MKVDQITIVDMNAVEGEIVELMASVLALMIFRLLRQAAPRSLFRFICFLKKPIDTSHGRRLAIRSTRAAYTNVSRKRDASMVSSCSPHHRGRANCQKRYSLSASILSFTAPRTHKTFPISVR